MADQKQADAQGVKETVVVTGATGFVASHVVKMLLEQGYTVRGTVRSLEKKEKFAHLKALPGADERLQLFAANLTDAGSFDEAVSGSDYVIHVASPYAMVVKDPQKDLVEPAVQGVQTVFESALKAKGVRRIVVTSSMAAITDSPKPKHTYTEEDWNEESNLGRNPYYYSKKLAEKRAWKLAEEVRQHQLTHVPPRSWCRRCVEGGACADPHAQMADRLGRGRPAIDVELFFVGTVRAQARGDDPAFGRAGSVGRLQHHSAGAIADTACRFIPSSRREIRPRTTRIESACRIGWNSW